MSRFILTAGVLLLLAPFTLAQEKKEEKKEEKPKDTNTLPLKPNRTIEFTTDEGTWMSLDLSPDGNTIVFELLGDLYTMPATGGEATRIVGGIHFDAMPRFSPDGKKIVFVSDRSGGENLFLIDPDGKNPKALTTGRRNQYLSPNWTPDGNYVFASKANGGLGSFSLMTVDIRGGSGMPFGPKPPDASRRGTNRMGAVASADGKFLFYAERQGLWTYDSRFPLWQIQRWNRQTGESQTITNALGSGMRPMVSPDGKTLVYATRYRTETALKTRNLETGEEKWLAFPIDRDNQEAVASQDTIAGYDFTPDGKHLIMPLRGKIQKLDMATGLATVIPFSAKVQSEVNKTIHFDYKVDDTDTVKARIIRTPSLSPDGKKLLFTAFNRMYVMDYPAGKPVRITKADNGEFEPSWSPDGKWITYVTWGPQGGQVQKIPAEGGDPLQLTTFSGYYSSPVFTSDGSKVIYMAGTVDDGLKMSYVQETHCFELPEDKPASELGGVGPNTSLDIYSVPSYGGARTLIAGSQGYGSLQTGKDPNKLYMVGAGGLSSIRLDGLDRRQLIKVTGNPSPGGSPYSPADIRISPDGNSAFVSIESKLYTVTLPPLGGDAIDISIGGGGNVPVKKVSVEGADFLEWTRDGKALTWALGDKFYYEEIAAEKPTVTPIAVEMPRYKPQGSVLLKNARIITMKGDLVWPKGNVVIKNNRIVHVAPSTVAFKLEPGTKVIDCAGKTVSPGFVDVHAHWFGPGGPKLAQSWGYLTNLAYGVTTNRDPQSGSPDIYDYSDMIETGQAIGPRIYTTGPGVFAGSGIDDQEAVKNYIKRYAEAYKTMTLKQYVAGDRMTRQQVAIACEEYKITPTTEGALDFKLNLTQMMDGFSGHEHSLPITPLYNDAAQFIAKTNTFYTPTLLVNYGAPTGENFWFMSTNVATDAKLRRFVPDELLDTMVRRRPNWVLPEEYNFSAIAASCAKVVRAGGKVCLGSHGQLQGLGAHWELWSLASGGMTPMEALRCATLNGAEAIGLTSDIGSIEPGKLADLVIYDKNPLDNIRNTASIRYVVKNGEIFEADTMDQIWPTRRPMGPIYYQNYGPKQTIIR